MVLDGFGGGGEEEEEDGYGVFDSDMDGGV